MLFLDEPSAGLDPQTRLLLWEIIREYNRSGKTILLTTHNMEEADALCQRIAIIDHGHIIALGTPRELKSSIPGGYLLRLRFDRVADGLLDRLKALPGVTEVRPVERRGRRSLRRPRRRADLGYREPGIGRGRRAERRAHLRAQPGEPVSAPYRKEPARMNWKTFTAMLARDAHVARRNLIPTLLQNLLQPLMFVFVFGRVMTTAGMLPEKYKSMLLPGIMAMSMIMSGVWAVAMPLISEFQFTKEIEDRLLAPMDVGLGGGRESDRGHVAGAGRRRGRAARRVGHHGLRPRPSASTIRWRSPRWRCWWRCFRRPAAWPWAAPWARRRSA